MTSGRRAFKVLPGPKLERFLKLVRVVTISAFVLWITPDIISDPTNELSYGYFTRVFGPMVYPDSEAARNASSVVIINQKSLDDINHDGVNLDDQPHETWPPSFRFHAAVLERILAAEPAVIVIDFLLVDARQDKTLDQLIDALKLANQAGVPVIIARGSFSEYGENRGILPKIEKLVTPAAGWSQGGGHSPFRYALYPRDESKSSPSIAMAAFEAYCEQKGNGAPTSCPERVDEKDFAREMWVFWSSRLPDFSKVFQMAQGEPFRAVKCARYNLDDGILDYLIDIMLLLPPESTCPPQIVLPAHYVIKDPDERIDNAFKDRVVFYGFNLEGIQDTVRPPTTTDDIPGVFMQAMAFENLIEWGPDYLSLTESRNNGFITLTADFFEIATLSTILILYFVLTHHLSPYVEIFLNKKYETTKYEYETTENLFTQVKEIFLLTLIFYKNNSGRRKWLRWAKISVLFLAEIVLLFLILIGVSLFIEMELFRIAPVNWLAILSMFGAVRLLSHN